MTDRNLRRRLRAMSDPVPPADLAGRLERDIPDSFGRGEAGGAPGPEWMVARLGATAASIGALVWVVLSVLPGSGGPGGPGTTVAAMLDPVARATGSAPAVHIVMRAWSRTGEPFSFVDPAGEPQTFEAWIEMPGAGGAAGRARVSKGDRVRGCDGRETVAFFPGRGEAIRSAGCVVEVETFWPAAWVLQLKAAALAGGTAIHEGAGSGGTARLVLREPGVPVAGRKKAFLPEFDRETEIVWDPATSRLTGLRRWVIEDGRHLVAETMVIEYLDHPDGALFAVEVPPDVRWVTLREAPETLAGLGPREVTRRFLEAAVASDRDTLEILGASPHTAASVAAAGVSAVVSVGEPFRTGVFRGVYVPYVVTLGRGEEAAERRHNLALRDDNPQKRWVFDGGF